MTSKGGDRATVGLIQMRCAPEPAANLETAVRRIEDAARAGAQIICLQELFLTHYFCQREETRLFDLAQEIPGPATEHLAKVAKRLGVDRRFLVRDARRHLSQHRCDSDADGSLLGIYRKMHIPEDPLYFEKYYFTPGDLASRRSNLLGGSGCLSAGTSGFPSAARPTALLHGRQILFTRQSAGIPKRKLNSESSSTRHGGHASAPTPSPTASMSPLSTVWATKAKTEMAVFEFWGGSVVAGPFGEILSQPPRSRREPDRRVRFPPGRGSPPQLAPSFAIVASMPMTASPNDF